MNEMMIIIFSIVVLAIGFGVAYFFGSKAAQSKIKDAELRAEQIIKDAEKEANTLKKERLLEIKEEWHKKKQEFENDTQSKKAKLQVQEKQLKSREEVIDTKIETVTKKEKSLQLLEQDLEQKQIEIDKKTKELSQLFDKQLQQLEHISGLSKEEAKKHLMDTFINDAKTEAQQLVKKIRDEAQLSAQREAQTIIIQAIQRTASDHSVESTVSVVNLDSDDMKGRIIGREGRNIRAFEAATGIDLIIDDTPEAVVISGFDPFRREVAKRSLEKLMGDGRIHPTRIEEIVEKTQQELENEIVNIGENATLELGIHKVHPEILKLIGRMKYRSSYGQNLLSHSIEVSYLCGLMAAELGLDPQIAKRAGLMHDMGKCVDRNTEGPHALLGMEVAKKFRESKVITNAIGAHHEDIEMETPYAVLVQAADSISGARPGARRESLENYIKRLEKLEGIADSYEGVAKTFAIQAGREVRVIVEPEKINDVQADEMASGIASRIESEMEYPGQIKVTVVRERRSVALAK